MKKVLSVFGNTLFYALLIVLVLLAYGALPNRWYRIVMIEGGSMSPTLNFGDVIVVTPPTQKIAARTIIVMNVDGSLVTHRLLTDFQNGGWPETKGDDNNVADNFSGSNLKIVGEVHYYIPYVAYPFMYLRFLVSKIGS